MGLLGIFIKNTQNFLIKYLNFYKLVYKDNFLGPLAQLVEHLPFKEGVDGSSPSGLTTISIYNVYLRGVHFPNLLKPLCALFVLNYVCNSQIRNSTQDQIPTFLNCAVPYNQLKYYEKI